MKRAQIDRIRDWSELDGSARRQWQGRARAHAVALNAVVNAFVEVTPSPSSLPAGTLNGLPYAAKDIFCTPKREPRCGTTIAPRIQGFSHLLEALQSAGADLVAFTAMTELAFEPSGFNAALGRTRNPWNLDFISGGSSSGSAVAVASGAVVAALGSDTGGSIRIPAHACGVTGWKPTHGGSTASGVMPLAPTLDTVGVLARSADDLLLLAPCMAPACCEHVSHRAVVADDVVSESEPAIRHCLSEAVAAIEATGLTIERRPALEVIQRIDRHALVVMQGESARLHQSLIAIGPMEPTLRRRLEKGSDISDTTLAGSINARSALVQQLEDQVLCGSDVLIIPVMPIATPVAERCDPTSPRFSARTLYALSRWTRFVNMLGLPAVAMPAGFDENSMPVGVQIIGRAGSDLTILALVRRVQEITNWHARVPRAVAHLLLDLNGRQDKPRAPSAPSPN